MDPSDEIVPSTSTQSPYPLVADTDTDTDNIGLRLHAPARPWQTRPRTPPQFMGCDPGQEDLLERSGLA